MTRLLKVLLLTGTAVFLLTLLAVYAVSNRMSELHAKGRSIDPGADMVIVLGAGVDPDGILNFPARRRVKAAVRLVQAGKATRLIMSGGTNTPDTKTNARLMAEYAIQLGVPADRVLLEEQARTTWENLRFSMPMARAVGAERIVILTDTYHLWRSAQLAAFLDYDVGLAAARGIRHEHWTRQVPQYGREAMAWWYNLGKAGAWIALGWAGMPDDERAALVF